MTSVPPAQPPAAPETDTPLLDEMESASREMALLADLSAARERVRVVEGERDAWKARSRRHSDDWATATVRHERLMAAVEALAGEFERPDETPEIRLVAAPALRALLPGGAR